MELPPPSRTLGKGEEVRLRYEMELPYNKEAMI